MSLTSKIRAAISYAGLSQAKCAAMIGMTPSNFSQKLNRGTFTEDELHSIAAACNAAFIIEFSFPDGTKI